MAELGFNEKVGRAIAFQSIQDARASLLVRNARAGGVRTMALYDALGLECGTCARLASRAAASGAFDQAQRFGVAFAALERVQTRIGAAAARRVGIDEEPF